jgi:NAD(P)-dependent dehydrogenase (short-subunit alcohol dehydrogenase family)
VSDGLDGGAAIATRLAANNARVVVHYGHNKDLALQVLETLDGKGHLTLGADLADPANWSLR